MDYYFSPLTQKEQQLPIHLFGLGTETQQPRRTRDNTFPYNQLAYCEHGSGIFRINNKDYKIEPGMFFFFPKNIEHTYYPVDEPWCVHWILFSGPYADTIISLLDLNKNYAFSVYDSTAYHTAMNTIHKIISSNKPTKIYELSGALYNLLTSLYSLIQQSSSNISSNQQAKIAKVINYIDTNCCKDITLGELAAHINVSESYLCRSFKSAYGETPQSYVIRRKITEAKKLLLEFPNKKIKDISTDIGFSDHSYFGATFKKYEGCTPKEFRNAFLQ